MRSRYLFIILAATLSPVFAQTPPASSLPPIKGVTMVRKLAPVYPYDLLIKGKTGWAEVRFMVDYSGRAVMTTIAEASNPVFGHSLLADIEANEFMPPRVNGQPQISLTGQRYSFDETGLEPSEKRILAELRKPTPAIVPANELDKPLAPTRRDPPVFPYALQSDALSGRAEIEFIIDRDGRVCFPRVLNTSHEDFGWAAATGISRWRYQPPLKGGQKVDARTVQIVTFDHTKGAVSF